MYLYNRDLNSSERLNIIQKVVEHRTSQNSDLSFKYQLYNIHRKNVSRFKVFSEQIFAKYEWQKVEDKLKYFVTRLVNKEITEKDDTLSNEILTVFERDKNLCIKINRFCFHNSILAKFVLKSLTNELRHTGDYHNLKRLLELEDLYTPYFENHEKCQLYYNNLRYKYRNRQWEQLSEEVETIKNHYHNNQQDIVNKVNLLSYITVYNVMNNKCKEQEILITDILNEISLNPYRNIKLNSNLTKFIFDDYMHINKLYEAKRFYIDMQRTTSVTFKHAYPNYLYSLGLSLSLYDLVNAKKYFPEIEDKALLNTNYFILPYIARYFYLTNNFKKANFYILHALKMIKKSNSSVYFIETYSNYLAILFKEKKYKKIIDVYESITFKINYSKSHTLGKSNYALRFFYLAAKFYLSELSHLLYCSKLYQLVFSSCDKADMYIKLNVKKNMDMLIESNLTFDSRLSLFYNELCKEMKPMEIFSVSLKENPIKEAIS